MSEIEFRAKDLFDKWIYGGGVIPVYENTYKTNKMEMVKSVEYDELDIFGAEYDSIEIQPETLGQYIGIKDKNGVKVYEGDIVKQFVKGWGTLIRVIKKEMSCGSCCSQVIGFGASGELHTDFIHFDKEFEVIGNIYENPELLEVEDE